MVRSKPFEEPSDEQLTKARGDCGDESDSEGRMKQSLYILAQQEIVSKMGNVIAFRK